MIELKTSKFAALISAFVFFLTFYFSYQPLTINLNTYIGWGWGFVEYLAVGILICWILSMFKTIKAIIQEKLNVWNGLSMFLNLFVFFYFGRLVIHF